ncbi:hypothetical protein EVAR_38348_1 [Eumeta japonica]|uniref:Uncharacterized protein n=1 Tax=Eumeta variegata TaxID=151549 RepID=A0A4C1XXI2_EUMVA|nr:hypothetical protein EVAR_38348_1 [Eumeta japonica]
MGYSASARKRATVTQPPCGGKLRLGSDLSRAQPSSIQIETSRCADSCGRSAGSCDLISLRLRERRRRRPPPPPGCYVARAEGLTSGRELTL